MFFGAHFLQISAAPDGAGQIKWNLRTVDEPTMSRITAKLTEYLVQGKFTDVSIYCQGTVQPIRAHRYVLAKHCGFFRCLFKYDPSRTSFNLPPNLVQDHKFNRTFFNLVSSKHTSLEGSDSDAADLMISADYFAADDLRGICNSRLLTSLSVKNCFDVFGLSQFYPWMLDQVESFVARNFETIVHENSDLRNITLRNMLSLLQNDDLQVSSEMIIWQGVSQWVKHDISSRAVHLAELLGLVHLELLKHSETLKIENDCKGLPSSVVGLFRKVNHIQVWKHYVNDDEPMPLLPLPRRRKKCLKLSNELAISCGGWTNFSPSIELELYDPNYDLWFSVPLALKLPKPRAYHGSACLDNKFYVIGGFNGFEYFNSLFRLDLVSLEWEELTPMNHRRCYVSAVVMNGFIYVMGGFDGINVSRRLRICERYDPDTNTWELMANMNRPRSDAAAVTYNGKIWILGGFNGSEYLKTVEQYDPELNLWENKRNMQTKRGGVGCAILNGKLLAIGGNNGYSRLRSVEALDLENPNDSWHEIASLKTRRSNFGVCSVPGSKVIVVGGYEDPLTTSNCEWFDGLHWHTSENLSRSASALTLTWASDCFNIGKVTPKLSLNSYLRKKRKNRISFIRNSETIARYWGSRGEQDKKATLRALIDAQGNSFDVYDLQPEDCNIFLEDLAMVVQGLTESIRLLSSL